MLDREDIDALLIGRLYGELSSADEARLQAYLAGSSEQAKADKRALEDMTSARTAVRESRLLAEQVDPPQSISALLMQEAARRAPKQASETEGWFARFVRSFMAHPAMAAAATLVLVVAVGGTLYMRNGKQLAEERIASAPAEPARLDQASAQERAAPAMAAAPSAGSADLGDMAPAPGQIGAGDGIVVGLEDSAKGRAEPAKPVPRGIAVTTPQPQPKEYDEERRRKDVAATGGVRDEKMRESQDKLGMVADDAPETSSSDELEGAGMPAPKSDETADLSKKKAAKKKPDAPTATAPSAPVAPPPPPPPPPVTKQRTKEQKQHEAIVAAAKAQRCDTATSLALQLEESNPSYYDAEVKNDRDLKGCIQRIEQTVSQKRSKKAQPAERTKKPTKAAPAPTSTK